MRSKTVSACENVVFLEIKRIDKGTIDFHQKKLAYNTKTMSILNIICIKDAFISQYPLIKN